MDDTIVLKKTNIGTPTGIGVLGSLCAAQLMEHGKILLFIDPTDLSVRVEYPEYSIPLTQIDEDTALSILVALGRTDLELQQFLAETSDDPSKENTPPCLA